MRGFDLAGPVLVLAALLSDCSSSGPGDGAPAPPPVAAPDPARSARLERRLHGELQSLRTSEQSIDQRDVEQVAALVGRWRAFADAARGTRYEPIAREWIEHLERRAEAALDGVRRSLADRYRSNDWDGMARVVAEFVGRFSGTPAAARVEGWGAAGARVARAMAGVPRQEVGGGAEEWKAAVERGQVALEKVGLGSYCAFNSPGSSVARIRFDLQEPPPEATLWLLHTATYNASQQRATITIAVNGQGLCIDWLVPIIGLGSRSDEWPVGRWLRKGSNEIVIAFGETSLAAYRLYRVELIGGLKPPFPELLEGR